MRSWVSLLPLAGAVAVLLAACTSSSQCVIDTDCPLDQRCSGKRCVPVGPLDAGSPEGGGFDAPFDSGPPTDAGSADAATSDAGPPPACADDVDQMILASQPVANIAESCGATSCLGMADPCVSTCVVTTTAGDGGTGLTMACADCYQAAWNCAVANCLSSCAGTPDGGTACTDCLCGRTGGVNCNAMFTACSGVPTCM